MTFDARLGDALVTRATVTIPPSGAWWADVQVVGEEILAGVQTVTIGGLELVGTIGPGGAYVGSASYRLDSGAGQWGKLLPARSYQGADVRLATVVADLAAETGETIATGFVDRSLGPHWERPAGPAYRALDALVGADGWWVRPDGQTSLVTRASAAVGVDYDVLDWQPDERIVTVAAEAPAEFVPGATVLVEEVAVTLGTVVLELAAGGLRVRSWCQATDPLRDALEDFVDARVGARLHGVWEYRLALIESDMASLQPTDPACGLSDLPRVPWRPGIPGCTPEPQLGSICHVVFVNGDRSKPRVIGFEGPDGQLAVPDSVALDAGGALDVGTIELGESYAPVVRYGETVTVGAETGPITWISPPLGPVASVPTQSKVRA